VTVGNEIPGGNQQRQAQPAEANATPRDQSRKSEEIVNYEISKTTKTEVIEGGRVNRISVAVLVDGTYGKNDKGDVTYQPRSKEEVEQIGALVRSAIGFDQKRGDQVQVVNLRFAETPAIPMSEPTTWLSTFQFTKDDVMRAIEMAVMGVLGFVVLLLVVRPLVRRIITPDDRKLAALPAGAGGTLPAPGSAAAIATETAEAAKTESSPTAKMIDIAQIQGQVHAQSVQKVGDLADNNPRETISIIRSWLNDSAAA
jgi:flagellar M-ring protein FliF